MISTPEANMKMEATDTLILMVRPNLDQIPNAPLPAPFSLRPIQNASDAAQWLAVVRAAEALQTIPEDTFTRAYGSDWGKIAARVYLLYHGESGLVGTVAAWDGANAWQGWGRIHWLYLLPAYQGRGLGKAMLAFALQRLVALGHTNAYLKTSTGRPSALRLYENYGFIRQEMGDSD